MGEKQRPYWLDHDCPRWCHGVHHGSDFVGDRFHGSDRLAEVKLTVMEPFPGSAESDDEDYYEQVMLFYLYQGYREVEPRVHIEKEDTREGMYALTLSEAEQAGKVLLNAVALAREKNSSA